tara:strand:+ start:279 stop:599 length:321 start_codon:yes stop_codon:yes gene_type:complete
MSGENGWTEYSRLVLKELETLASGIESLRGELQEVKQELAKMQVREDKVQEIVKWKQRIDEVASPSQLKDLQVQVEDLKLFKTKAVTIFAVVQFAMAAIVFLQRFM